jgi:hypothetical protein
MQVIFGRKSCKSVFEMVESAAHIDYSDILSRASLDEFLDLGVTHTNHEDFVNHFMKLPKNPALATSATARDRNKCSEGC